MNIFKELLLSIYDFKSYQIFLKNKMSKIFGAGMLIISLYFFITIVMSFVGFLIEDGGLRKNIEENVMEFELKNGTLYAEEPFQTKVGDLYIDIDTDPYTVFYGADEIGDFLSEHSQAILMDSEKIIVKNRGEIVERYFSDLEWEMSKETLIQWVPYAYGIILLFMICVFLLQAGLFFFGVLFVALLGMIVASCMRVQLTFGQLYQLSIYTRTLPLIIKAILGFLPFSIPFFGILNFGLSVLYLVFAINKIKESNLEKPLEFTSDF